MATIQNRIIELREEAGMTRLELATKLNINRSNVTRYETGEMKPSLDVLISLSSIFGVSIDYLVGISEDRISSQPNRVLTYQKNYNEIISKCEKNNITPEKLSQIIDVFKS